MPDETSQPPQPETPPVVEPTTEPTPTSRSAHSKSFPWKIIAVLVAFTLIAAIAISAYLFYQSPQANIELPTENIVSPTPTPETPTGTPTIDPTADWETYIDQYNNVSIKYPQTWQKNETREAGPPCVSNTTGNNTEKETIVCFSFFIDRDPKLSATENIHNYFENQTSFGEQDLAYLNEDNVLINNLSVWVIEFSTKIKEEVNIQKWAFYQPENFSDRYAVVFISPYSNIYNETFDQILSTFEFVE